MIKLCAILLIVIVLVGFMYFARGQGDEIAPRLEKGACFGLVFGAIGALFSFALLGVIILLPPRGLVGLALTVGVAIFLVAVFLCLI